MAKPKQRRQTPLSVFVLGAGKVGQGLARALRVAGVPVKVRAARKKLPRSIEATLVVVAVRDGHVGSTAERLVGVVSRRAAVVHVAGALEPDALSPLRGSCAGVAQMHPLISFASTRLTPSLEGGNLLVRGDAPAVARAKQLARKLGMVARTFRPFDAVAYHAAAAGLVANGAAALASVGAQLLAVAGVPANVAPRLLGPLLRSVAENVSVLGFPNALTGPVRRGDAAAVERHLATLSAKLPEAVSLYLASAAAQLPLARAMGEGPQEGYDAIASMISRP